LQAFEFLAAELDLPSFSNGLSPAGYALRWRLLTFDLKRRFAVTQEQEGGCARQNVRMGASGYLTCALVKSCQPVFLQSCGATNQRTEADGPGQVVDHFLA